MKITTLIAALAITTAPAFAQDCGSSHKQTARMSCAEGLMLDPETNTCIPTVAS